MREWRNVRINISAKKKTQNKAMYKDNILLRKLTNVS